MMEMHCVKLQITSIKFKTNPNFQVSNAPTPIRETLEHWKFVLVWNL